MDDIFFHAYTEAPLTLAQSRPFTSPGLASHPVFPHGSPYESQSSGSLHLAASRQKSWPDLRTQINEFWVISEATTAVQRPTIVKRPSLYRNVRSTISAHFPNAKARPGGRRSVRFSPAPEMHAAHSKVKKNAPRPDYFGAMTDETLRRRREKKAARQKSPVTRFLRLFRDG